MENGERRKDGLALALASADLADLLVRARAFLREHGEQHTTQRGTTRTANLVALTWLAPHRLGDERVLPWTAEDAAWYLRVFVEASDETDPLRPVAPGELLFPYTYAARSRFWDAGWAAFVSLLDALRGLGLSVVEMVRSRDAFADAVDALGETLHLQTVLSLLAMYPPAVLARYLERPELAAQTAAAWRRDTLLAAIGDVEANPHSRRAVVPSLCYPHLEAQLRPEMGKPAYQMFQLLPDSPERPISSVHEHRSLDVVGGAQLDFLHDLAWLRLAGERLGRQPGDITVIAHNLHEYEGEDETASGQIGDAPPVERWLCRVTDGYRAGHGIPGALLAQSGYRENLDRIFARWAASATHL